MARRGDLKKDFLLALEHDFPVVDPPRSVHKSIKIYELAGCQWRGFQGVVDHSERINARI
jgi:hypothetical protein